MKIKSTILAVMVALSTTGLAVISTVSATSEPVPAVSQKNNVDQQLTANDTQHLVFMREEEKLARDVYKTLHEQWGIRAFNNISGAEQRHMDKIKSVLTKNNIEDPVTDDSIGVFKNEKLQNMFNQLVQRGKQSEIEALKVGALIEETDILDLRKAANDTSVSELSNIYNNLMRGSRNHLRAFVSQLEKRGVDYQAQVMTQADVDAIVNSPRERGKGHGR